MNMYLCCKLCCVCMLVLAVNGIVYDYTKEDFCKNAKCMFPQKNSNPTGCIKHCKHNPNIIEFTDNHIEFRQAMVDIHNVLRQRVASGSEKSLGGVKASNMNALSYDLATEHLARCWLHSKYGVDEKSEHYHDMCSIHPKFKTNTGQNLAWNSNENTVKEIAGAKSRVENGWYAEVKNIPSGIIDKFGMGGNPHKQFGHFTAVVWATMTHIGCAHGTGKKSIGALKAALICDYVSLESASHGANMLGDSVFKKGPGCSKCPSGRACNSKYSALCGKIESIPQELPTFLSGAKGAPDGKGRSLDEGIGGKNETALVLGSSDEPNGSKKETATMALVLVLAIICLIFG